MRELRARFSSALLLMFAGQATAMLFPLLATPLLISRLGLSGFGEVMFVFTIAMYLGVLVDFGFNVSSMHALTVARVEDPERMHEVVSRTVSARMLLAALAATVTTTVALTVPTLDAPLLLIAAASLLGNVIQVGWILQALQQVAALAFSLGASRLVALGALALMVDGPGDREVALALMLSPVLGSALIGWVLLMVRGEVRLPRPTGGMARALGSGSAAFTASLASAVLIGAGSIALGVLRTPAEVGIFSGAARIVAAARSSVTPVQTVLFPQMSLAHASGVQGWERRPFLALVVPHAVLAVAIFLSAEWITTSYLGVEAPVAVLVLQLFSVALLLAGLEVWAFSVLVAGDSARAAALSYSLAALVLVVVTLPAAAVWGVVGATAATVVGQVLVVALLVAGLRGKRDATVS
ncbi:oligosaccharide flippase family protein [Nocardioides xinjiangensis]|uniref:oligosaccharide flippase family protein n=1 Tax=Nocardioides xinjiangensis TaxID=2817376 RepID=UPI001B301C4D|nr:oligosaccharide flippase family protein [Nocardioides sp. SYSU D00778]